MASLSITATSVTSATTTQKIVAQAGETITGGMTVYKRTSGGLWWKMQADAAVGVGGGLEEAGVGLDLTTQVGIALGGATANVWFAVQAVGPIIIGATVVKGKHYYVSATVGVIEDDLAALTSGQYIVDIGYATSTTVIQLGFNIIGTV